MKTQSPATPFLLKRDRVGSCRSRLPGLNADRLAILVALFLASPFSDARAISINGFGITYSQDFNTLASSGTSSTLPAGWESSETLANANATYATGTGSSATGDTYSFGSSGSTDRALGGLRSGSLAPLFGAVFENNVGSAVTSLQIAYTGEQWRMGALGRVDRLNFEYSLTASSLTSPSSWTALNALDFTAPTTTGTVGALDGNNSANRLLLSSTFSLNWAAGSTLWIRWTDFDATGADDGLAVDDFSLTARQSTSVPESGTSWIGGVTILLMLALARRTPTGCRK